MKKLGLLVLISLIIQTDFFGQCLPDGILFSNQAEIDSFEYYYGGCTIILGDVIIIGEDITNLNGLANITSIRGELLVANNPSLKDFTGLNNLRSILGSLQVGNYLNGNSSLISFSGLENLDSIGSILFISKNQSLTDISAIENMKFNGYEILIQDNPLLSYCHIQSICNYLENPSCNAVFKNNSVGCNSLVEVTNNCLESIQSINTVGEFFVYPNPATDQIQLSSSETKIILNLKILNIKGQTVLIKYNSFEKIDISELDSGLYIIELVTKERLIRQRLVIN